MKKLSTCLLLLLLSFNLFAEFSLYDYMVIPMREKVHGYDSPGFYLNFPHEIESFGNWGTYWRIAELIDVSSAAYTFGDQVAPFFKIRTNKGKETWVFGGDVIVVSTNKQKKKGWYYNPDSGHQHMQIFYVNNQFYFVTSSNSNVSFTTETGMSAVPENFYENIDSSGWASNYEWDRAEGNYLIRSKSPRSENYDYISHYYHNFRLLMIEKTLQPSDEWFWYYYNEKNYIALLDLKARGYGRYDSPYISKGESPFFKSLRAKDYEMMEFLIENGFSQTVYGGNYDGTISCLWQPIKDDDYEMIKFLLDAGVGKDLGGEMGTDWDLDRVIRYSTPKMLQLFIDGGYDVTQPTYGYSNGEDSGGSGSFLFNAVYKDNIEMVKILIDNGANVNFLAQQYNFRTFTAQTPLEAAKSPSMTDFLKSYGALDSHSLTVENYRNQGFGLMGKMNDTRVRFRDKPGLDGTILGHFEKGEELIVINLNVPFEFKDGKVITYPWLLVRRDSGEIGWVSGEFVDIRRGFKSY